MELVAVAMLAWKWNAKSGERPGLSVGFFLVDAYGPEETRVAECAAKADALCRKVFPEAEGWVRHYSEFLEAPSSIEGDGDEWYIKVRGHYSDNDE